jgi:hypothetical protein
MSLASCVVKVSVGADMIAENTSRSACFATGALGSVVGTTRRKLSNTAWGTSVANSGTLLRYVTMRVSGRKPQSAVKDVIASAISGLWFGSAKTGFGLFYPQGSGSGFTFVNVWLLRMQLLCCCLIRVTLYAECLLDGQHFEKIRKIALFRAKFLGDPFANQTLVLGKIAGKSFSRGWH